MIDIPAVISRIGPEALIRPIIESLGIRQIVDRFCPMERVTGITHGQAIEALVYNRLLSPQPLCHVESWFETTSLSETLGFGSDQLNDDRLARALDAVSLFGQDIHAAATLKAITAFSLDTRLVHHDTTSFYFTGDYEDQEEWITYGYSRDKRPDTKQMNLAMTINGAGVPLDHTTLPGNENDVSGFKQRMDGLRARLPEGSRLVVTDRGMVSADNLEALVRQGFDFIASLKLTESQRDLVRAIPLEDYRPVADRDGYFTHDAEWLIGNRHHRITLVYSEEKAKRDHKRRERLLKEIREGLSAIHQRLNKRDMKERDAIRDKVRDLLKETQMAPYFDFKVEGRAGEWALKVVERADLLERDAQMDGIYVLVTSLRELAGGEILHHYKSRAMIEQRIKDLKSHIRLRPIFLHDEARIHGLVLVTVLALLVYSLLEVVLRQLGRKETVKRLFKTFRGELALVGEAPDGQILRLTARPMPKEEAKLLAQIQAVVKTQQAA